MFAVSNPPRILFHQVRTWILMTLLYFLNSLSLRVRTWIEWLDLSLNIFWKLTDYFYLKIFLNTDGAILAWNSINHMWPVQPTSKEFNAFRWPSAKNIDSTSVIQRIHELTNVSQLSIWVLQCRVQITCPLLRPYLDLLVVTHCKLLMSNMK